MAPPKGRPSSIISGGGGELPNAKRTRMENVISRESRVGEGAGAVGIGSSGASIANSLRQNIPIKATSNAADGEYKEKFRKLYEEKLHTDWTIISSDGVSFLCHRAILSLNVPYFREVLAKPEVPKNYQMTKEMSVDSETLDALLRFIYYNDLSSMKNNGKLTTSMIRVAISINFAQLMDTAIKYLATLDPVTHFDKALNELNQLNKVMKNTQSSILITSGLKQKLSEIIIDIVGTVFGFTISQGDSQGSNN